MQQVIEREKKRRRVTPQKFADFNFDLEFPLKRENEYNLKEKMELLIGSHTDFTGKLEEVNLVIGIIVSIAIMLFIIF